MYVVWEKYVWNFDNEVKWSVMKKKVNEECEKFNFND